jgi:asparagine synthase (glutamine-hydrolysing)
LHGAESIPEFKQFCDVHLHGYLGDATAGGSYLGAMDPLTFLDKKMLLKHVSGLEMTNPLGYLEQIYSRALLRPDRFLVDQRGRRFINFGSVSASAYLEWRYPFFDKDYIMFVFAIPDSLRSDSYIYQQMLLHEFPEYYRDIPWQKTGSPIGSPSWRKRFQGTTLLAKKAITHGGQKLGVSWLNLHDSYVNYPLWLRSEPSRSLVAKLLMSSDALYADHLNREIARNIVVDFMDNNDDFHLTTLGLLLTFEIYLRQLAGSEGFRGNGPG